MTNSQDSRRDDDAGEADVNAIEAAFGAWTGRGDDGKAHVDRLRSGERLADWARRSAF